MSIPLLQLDQLSKFYTGGQSVTVGLNRIRLSFHCGEFVAITGESGSGKSTLANVISGILPYESGEMYLRGQPTSHFDRSDYDRYRRDQISYISQSYGILPSATVRDNVESALRLAGFDRRTVRERAEELLRQVELWPLRKRRAARLSSGQKQRLSIARALAKPSPILIADEPTGNLDPENTAKVIQLLAQASASRLVLLITHEFPTVEAYATRHITLHDGAVVSDAVLRDPAPPAEAAASTLSPKPSAAKGLCAYVAKLQTLGKPVWCSACLLFFALTAFAVFAFLGTLLMSLDDANTRVYNNAAFRNGDPLRIVAVRSDDADMTDADYETLLARVPHLISLERFGYIVDINYAYREGQDYDFHYYMENVGTLIDPVFEQRQRVVLHGNAPYMQTVPLLPDGQSFLSEGRLPENDEEIVAHVGDGNIGDTVMVYFRDFNHWTQHMSREVKIVGTTEFGSGLFFHTSTAQLFTDYLLYTVLDPEDSLTAQPHCNQVTLWLDDYAYTDQALKVLREAGYTAASPYRLGSTEQDPELAAQRTQTLRVCVLALAAVVLLQILLMWALFATQYRSYRLLRDIGLTERTALSSVALQLLCLCVAGQLLAIAGILLAALAHVERIVALLRYLRPGSALLLSGVHILSAMVGGIWVLRSLKRHVYPISERHDDLELEDETGKEDAT